MTAYQYQLAGVLMGLLWLLAVGVGLQDMCSGGMP